jgi:hypothetical protein
MVIMFISVGSIHPNILSSNPMIDVDHDLEHHIEVDIYLDVELDLDVDHDINHPSFI